MNIWAFPSFYPFNYPGMRWQGIFAHRQYKGLIASGASLKVVQPVAWAPPYPFAALFKDWGHSRKYNYPHHRVYDGIEVYHPRVQNLKPSRLNKPYGERYVKSITNFFKKQKTKLDPDNDIFYSQWIPDAAYVQVAAHRLGIRSAVMVIGDDVLIDPHKNAGSMAAFIQTWQEADIRLAVADYLAKEANKLVNARLDYSVIRRGVEYDTFVPAGADEKLRARKQFGIPLNKIAILTIGSAIVRKGWLDLLDALGEFVKQYTDFVLIAAHAGSNEIDLDKEAAGRGLTGNFINLGEVAPGEVNKLLNAADIFCLPSYSEGIANAVVEAMACGLPVITTNVCGHPELVKNGYNGILINPGRPEEILGAIRGLVQDKSKMEGLGNNARSFIVSEWGSFSLNASKLYDIFLKKQDRIG